MCKRWLERGDVPRPQSTKRRRVVQVRSQVFRNIRLFSPVMTMNVCPVRSTCRFHFVSVLFVDCPVTRDTRSEESNYYSFYGNLLTLRGHTGLILSAVNFRDGTWAQGLGQSVRRVIR